MYWAGNTADTAKVIFDVTGYFANDSPAPPTTPSPRTGSSTRDLAPGREPFHSRVKQTVRGRHGCLGVPADAVAVTGNVTVVARLRPASSPWPRA